MKWEGSILPYNKIKIFDLCTIFSNLISNAIEACERLNKAEKQVIYVHTYCFNEKLYLNIKNPILEEIILEDNDLPCTSKTDEKNHGFGLRNVQDTVRKYKGRFEYQVSDGWFEIEILI